MLDCDDRLIVTGRSLFVLREDAQATACDLQSMDDADLKVVELNFAVESGAEGFDHAAFEDWAGVCEDNLNDEDKGPECESSQGDNPAPCFRKALTRPRSSLLDLDRVSAP